MNKQDKLVPSDSFSPAQARVLNAAMDLFCEHGVAGTSLQMIADAIGVTKAAVYHQFPTKNEIVEATGGTIATKLEEKVNLAAGQPNQKKVREVLVDGMIRLAVENRREAKFIQSDPVMLRFINEDETYMKITQRLNSLLLGNDDSGNARVCVAMLQTAIGGTVRNPLVQDLSNEELYAHLKKLTYRLVNLIN